MTNETLNLKTKKTKNTDKSLSLDHNGQEEYKINNEADKNR